MKTTSSVLLTILFLLVMYRQSDAQRADADLLPEQLNSESFEHTLTTPAIEQDLLLVSVTPSGAISLVGEDVPHMILDQPSEGSELEIASLESDARCHCFGKVTADCYSTGALGGYNANCNTAHHRRNCCGQVKNAIAALSAVQKQNIADCLCNKNLADGTPIYATNAIGTQGYEQCSDKIGTLHQKPAYSVTTCKCPAGWLSDNNVDGGVTSDGKCKKQVCSWDATAFPPGNPHNVLVGTWGFTWQNTLWTFGTTANGGAPVCKTVDYPKGPCTITWQ